MVIVGGFAGLFATRPLHRDARDLSKPGVDLRAGERHLFRAGDIAGDLHRVYAIGCLMNRSRNDELLIPYSSQVYRIRAVLAGFTG